MSEYWDIHNHILPGVDDGSGCMSETMQMLKAEYEQGIRHLIFTPHYRKGMFEISEDDIRAVYQNVRSRCEREVPGLQLSLGRECFVHSARSTERFIADERYQMAGSSVLLLEFAYEIPFAEIEQSVHTVRQKGLIPALAHVERYACLREEQAISSLRDAGARIQVNCDSILGKEGLRTKHFCLKLLKAGQIDLIASDAHNMDNRPVRMKECIQLVTKKCGTDTAEQIFAENPRILFETKEKGA